MKRAERDDSLLEEPQDTKQLKRHDNNNNFLSFSILPVDLIEEILTFHYIQFYPITFKYYLNQKKLLKSEMFLFTCFGKKEERIIYLWKNVKIYDPLLFYNEFMKNQSVNPFLHCHSISIKGEADQKYKLLPFFTKLFEDYSKRVNSSLTQQPVLWSQSEDILIEPSITTPWIPSMAPLPDLSLNNVLKTSNNSNLQLTNDLNNSLNSNLNSNLHNLSNYSISLNSGLNNLTNNNSYTLNSLLNNMSQVNPPNSIQTSNSIRPLQPLPNSSLFPNSLNRSQFSQQLTQPNQFLPSQLLQNRPPLLNYNNTLQMNNNTISSSLLGNSMSSIGQPTLSLMSIPPTPPSNLQTALLNQLMNNNSNLSLGNNIMPSTPSMNYPTTTQHSISSTILNTISPQPINNNMMSTLSLNKLPPLRNSNPIKQEVIPPKVIYNRLEKLKINPVIDNYYFNISNDSFPNLKTLHCHIHSFNGLCSALKNNKISIKPKNLDSLIVDCNYIEVDFNSIYKNIKVIRFTSLRNQMLKPLESLLPYIEKAHLFIDDDHGEFLDLINRFNSKVVEIGLSNYYGGALINPSTLSSTPIELSNYENLLPKITSYSGNFDKALLNCKNLTSLDFGFNYTTFDNFTDFSIFPKLETLKLRLQHDKDYTSILSLKNLTKLSLKGITNFNSKSLQWLQLLENLKKLEIDNNSALDYLPPYLTTLTVESENSETDITNIIENYPTIVKLRVKVNLEVDSSGDAVNLLSTRRLICTNTDHLLDLNVTGTCHYDSSYE